MNQQNHSDVEKIFNEEFDFKPLSAGLGFHREKSITNHPKSYSGAQKKQQTSLSSANTLTKSELSSFYQPQYRNQNNPIQDHFESKLSLNANINKKEEPLLPTYTYAPFLKRLGAGAIDLAIILLMTLMLIVMTLTLGGIQVTEMVDLMLNGQLASFIFFQFSLVYLIYFSLLERSDLSSFGKSFFRLSVISSNSYPLTIGRTFFRSLISLSGVVSLGLINLLDIHSKLSETKTVEEL